MTILQEPEKLKRTPLYDRHLALHGKMVDFGGWNLPVYYTSILQEHNWTRTHASFFDVSHLGEIRVHGPGALEFLQHRLTNDLLKLREGFSQYHLICNEKGGTLDDILVYRGAHGFYLVVNASNIDKDEAALRRSAPPTVQIDNVSDRQSCIAIQGPQAEEALEKLFGFNFKDMAVFSFKENTFEGAPVWVSRTGYTGEDGFEIFSFPEQAPAIWHKLESAEALGLKPAGLGARNTLRLEAGNPLYGHELDEQTTPLEAKLGFAVSFDKGDFVGREALLKQKEKGLSRQLVGFKMLDRAVARDGYKVYSGARLIGHVTSGSFAPTVGGNIGMAFVETGFEKAGSRIEIEIHGNKVVAEVVKRPFVPIKHKK